MPRNPLQNFMLCTHTPPSLQIQPAAARIDPDTLEAIRAYSSNMRASVNAFQGSIQTLFDDHCAQTSTLIAIQQRYISDREALHQQQMQDIVDAFQRRCAELEAQLSAEQMQNFRRYVKDSDAAGGLDLWQDPDENAAAPISLESIEHFMAPPAAEELLHTAPPALLGEIQ